MHAGTAREAGVPRYGCLGLGVLIRKRGGKADIWINYSRVLLAICIEELCEYHREER